MIGPVFFEERDVEGALRATPRHPDLRRVIRAIARVYTPRALPPRKGRVGYRWDRLLVEDPPVVFQKPEGKTLDAMSKGAHYWARWHGAKVVTRQIDGALHVWLVRRPRDK